MNKKIVGIIIFVVLIAIIIGVKYVVPMFNGETEPENDFGNLIITDETELEGLTKVTVATGGGKEGFIGDKRVISIMQKRYGLNVIYDSWSNGKLIVNPLVREDGSKYDLMFCSDQRFYDYYRLAPDKSKGEADRYNVQEGGLILNTPIVIYSWDAVVDALIQENIVTLEDGTYFITDMNKLLQYILEGKKWTDIGLDIYAPINISSTDPVTSSPGATYYGLLLSIMCDGFVTEEKMEENLPKLKEFYEKSGYMNNTPADLFDSYLKLGMGAKPMIVDYEKSMVEFAIKNPDGYAQVKDHIRILYPKPTIWNSHCIASFDEVGNQYYEAFNDKEIQQIAWDSYGFRTGVAAGNYDVSSVGIPGIHQNITSTVTSLKMSMYNRLIEYLGE